MAHRQSAAPQHCSGLTTTKTWSWAELSLRTSSRFLFIGRWIALALLLASAVSVQAREKKEALDYGAGLIVNVPLPPDEVTPVVSDIAQNGIIRGTKEYNKDQYISGAEAASSSTLFPEWTDGGKVFYKVRKQALDPRNFKDSNDVGTLAVRYIVQSQGDQNTVLRIDAVFVEDFRHTVHPSNGSVEGSEYAVIHEHLDAIELMKKQNAEAEQARREQLAKKNFGIGGDQSAAKSGPAEAEAAAPPVRQEAGPEAPVVVSAAPDETIEQHVANLRQQVERRVKVPGAPLKSAPFHSASSLASLPSGAEVLIVISTPYWFGVETHDGLHGWIPREQLEELP